MFSTQRENDDESGLMYFRARHYSPRLGRFVQKDPVNDNKIFEHYIYAYNNPIIFADPFGLEAEWHHLLPKGGKLASFWDSLGINPNDSKFGWILDTNDHRGAWTKVGDTIHNQRWTKYWNDFVKVTRNSLDDNTINKEQAIRKVLEHLEEGMNSDKYRHLFEKGIPAIHSYREWRGAMHKRLVRMFDVAISCKKRMQAKFEKAIGERAVNLGSIFAGKAKTVFKFASKGIIYANCAIIANEVIYYGPEEALTRAGEEYTNMPREAWLWGNISSVGFKCPFADEGIEVDSVEFNNANMIVTIGDKINSKERLKGAVTIDRITTDGDNAYLFSRGMRFAIPLDTPHIQSVEDIDRSR